MGYRRADESCDISQGCFVCTEYAPIGVNVTDIAPSLREAAPNFLYQSPIGVNVVDDWKKCKLRVPKEFQSPIGVNVGLDLIRPAWTRTSINPP